MSTIDADLTLATGETRVVRRARRAARPAGATNPERSAADQVSSSVTGDAVTGTGTDTDGTPHADGEGVSDDELPPGSDGDGGQGPEGDHGPQHQRTARELLDAVIVAPDIRGPRVRIGVLWFLLALAAVTTSRMWTAGLLTLVASAAAYQTVRAWRLATYVLPEPDDSGRRPIVPPGTGRAEAIISALAVAVPLLASGFSTGAAGLMMLVIVALIVAVRFLVGRSLASSVAIGTLTPLISAISIVLAVQVNLWVGIYLVVAVSLYDAGNFLLGSEASKRWEGPVAGIIGVLAVTFTVATIGLDPLGTGQWWLIGVIVAVTCAPGQWLVSALLPRSDSWVPALRRLDAYLVAGPVLVALCWLIVK